MKVFQNSIMTMPIKSCKECPHRRSKAFKSGARYYTEQVCSAITSTNYNHLSKKEISHKTHPSVAEQMQCGGFHPECPLEDFILPDVDLIPRR